MMVTMEAAVPEAVKAAVNDAVINGNANSTAAEYHSLLAMEAARKMRRTRQKRKTGQEVCHHLKMMLAEPLPTREAKPANDAQFDFCF